MTIKEKLLFDIENTMDIGLLNQLMEIFRLLRIDTSESKRNVAAILKLAGTLPKEDAEEIKKIIDSEFNNIEGEW